jgi:hypothetical protein
MARRLAVDRHLPSSLRGRFAETPANGILCATCKREREWPSRILYRVICLGSAGKEVFTLGLEDSSSCGGFSKESRECHLHLVL